MPDIITRARGAASAPIDAMRAACVELVGRSAPIARVKELLRRSALLDSGVLIVGERGVDAASVARELHTIGRPAAPWIAVECGTSNAARLDRALFGSSRSGPATDLESVSADSSIAAACGGTLFLQDCSELAAGAQARLARVARDAEVRIDDRIVATEWRLVASAPPTIDEDVRQNRFRSDLFRRLAVSRIDLPSLRDRFDDVPALAARVLADLAAATGPSPRSFTRAALSLLSALNWPGNLAELRSVIARVLAESGEDVIQIEQVLLALQLARTSTAFMPAGSLRDARLRFERDYIAAVLQHHGWRMADAAQTLGIQRPNLYRKARQLGIPLARANA
jgi:two-component system, NtrC family, nitrogen regulation response regulator NtrX